MNTLAKQWTRTELAELPVVVIGAGPVGLAAAAHLESRGLRPVVLEAGDQVGAAIRSWGHIRTFTPWRYLVDEQAERLLHSAGWTRPTGEVPPTGDELVTTYLEPLAEALRQRAGSETVRTRSRVVAVSRWGVDRARTLGRADRPFVVRVATPHGLEEVLARAVIDASGTWSKPNPLGASGLTAYGEHAAASAGFLVGPLPDVHKNRDRYAGRTTLVVGMGHSAANTLINLATLASEAPDTRIVWAIRSDDPARLYGGGANDQLRDRGRLGTDLRSLVENGVIELVRSFSVTQVLMNEDGETVSVVGSTPEGELTIDAVHQVAAATGFRPDLSFLGELRLQLDPGLEAPHQLAPLIDPAFHSCGTVPPHGYRDLQHPEQDFFIVGMKAYGRAPTFLIATGNEEVRSVAAYLAGDLAAAEQVHLELPETGVCSVNIAPSSVPATSSGCCSSDPAPVAEDPHHRPLPVGLAPQGFSTGTVLAPSQTVPDTGAACGSCS